jgi:HNH endonuclease
MSRGHLPKAYFVTKPATTHTAFTGSGGYMSYRLRLNRCTSKNFLVHRLVALAHIPTNNTSLHVNHKDGNKTNNNVSNLEWVTQQQNNRHAISIGLVNNRGSNNPRAKLTEHKIRQIRASSKFYKDIATEYGVSLSTICHIKNMLKWKHV